MEKLLKRISEGCAHLGGLYSILVVFPKLLSVHHLYQNPWDIYLFKYSFLDLLIPSALSEAPKSAIFQVIFRYSNVWESLQSVAELHKVQNSNFEDLLRWNANFGLTCPQFQSSEIRGDLTLWAFSGSALRGLFHSGEASFLQPHLRAGEISPQVCSCLCGGVEWETRGLQWWGTAKRESTVLQQPAHIILWIYCTPVLSVFTFTDFFAISLWG